MFNVTSSYNYRTAAGEGGDCDALKVETYISDLNQQCQGLVHEASRLNRYNVENTDKLLSLKSRIEEFNLREIQLTREIEQLERKLLMSILQKGFEDEVDKFEEVKGIEQREFLKEKKLEQEFADLMLEIGKINDKFRDLGIVVEETKKSEVFKELGINLDGQQENLSQLVSDKEETTEKFEKLGNAVDAVNELNKANASDCCCEEEEIGDIGAQELCKEIELLEGMLEKGSFELLDLKTMMEETEASKGPERVMGEMEVKMWELDSGLRELKRAIVELKGKELKGWITKEEEKPNWGSIVASVGVAAVAVAAMVFVGRPSGMKFAAERGNKHKTGKTSLII
ncbi:hypothetical protein V6N13_143644 [Hibiscus sabdariffa]